MKKIKTLAVLLSYNRPQNLKKISENILAANGIDRLIISNNNPKIDIHHHINLVDHRVLIISQLENKNSAFRYEVLLDFISDYDYFVLIDDDIFLSPTQIEQLLTSLYNNSDRVHGMFGQNYSIKGGVIEFEEGLINLDLEVDIINRVYLFSKNALKRYYHLLNRLRIELSDVGFCDDIVLSLSQKQKPICHNIGEYLECPTSNEKGIALWMQDDFYDVRISFMKRILNHISSTNFLEI